MKLIGLVGYKKKEIINFKKKFKKFKFLNINDKNFYKNESTNVDALVVLFEYPIKYSLSKFLSEKFKLFKKLKSRSKFILIINISYYIQPNSNYNPDDILRSLPFQKSNLLLYMPHAFYLADDYP